MNYADKMVSALAHHIKYLQSAGRPKVVVTNGRLEERAGGRHIYRFDNEFAGNLDFDGDIEVQTGDLSLPAQIVSLEDKSVRLSLPSDCGQRIEKALILLNNYRLQEKLKERIHASKNRPGINLGNYLLDLRQPNTPALTATDQAAQPAWGQTLNRQQRAALECALKNSITYIWGPPGTGKTQVIASIIDSFIQNSLSVLLLSNTNIATDEALYKTADYFKRTGNPCLPEGRLIRIGKIHHRQLKEEFGQFITKEAIAERKTGDLQARINGYKEQVERHGKAKRTAEERLEQFKAHSDRLTSFQEKYTELTDKRCQYGEAAQELERNNLSIKNNERRREEYQNSRKLARVLSRNSIARFKAIEEQLLESQKLFQRKKDALAGEFEEGRKLLPQLRQQIEEAKAALAGFDKKRLDEQLQNANGAIGKLNKRIENLKAQAKELENRLVKEAKLIAATLTNSYLHSAILEREYDCVIIDEVSMALPPAVWYASNLARKRVVVVGDFMQLPPIAQYGLDSDERPTKEGIIARKLIDRWLKQDIFQLSGLKEAIEDERKELPSNLVALRRQYRMHKPIADLVNHLVYGRYRSGQFALQTGLTEDGGPSRLLSGSRLAVCDTSGQKPYVSWTANKSGYCVLHAVLAATLAQQAVEKGYCKVGIVTAYRAQANLIQMILKDKRLDKQVEANTIHSFQGGEKELMLFDITTPRGNSMYDKNGQEEEVQKRLNVALSRAQDECVIIGEIQAIRKNHSKTSPILSMLEYLKDNRFPFLPVEHFSTPASQAAGMDRALERITPMSDSAGLHIFNDQNFYEHFKHDIKEAKSEVIIISPFMTVKRAGDLMNLLDIARRKGVNVFVMTRHPRQQEGSMSDQARQVMEQLEAQGIVVLPMSNNLHQKLAFLDRRVFWSGSLNILSQSKSGENMFRQAPFENAIAQLIGELSFDQNIGELGENNMHRCEFCAGRGAWYWHDGRQVYCLHGRHRLKGVGGQQTALSNFQQASVSDSSQTSETPICPIHQVPMVARRNPKDSSDFWGCPEYKRSDCRTTLPKP